MKYLKIMLVGCLISPVINAMSTEASTTEQLIKELQSQKDLITEISYRLKALSVITRIACCGIPCCEAETRPMTLPEKYKRDNIVIQPKRVARLEFDKLLEQQEK